MDVTRHGTPWRITLESAEMLRVGAREALSWLVVMAAAACGGTSTSDGTARNTGSVAGAGGVPGTGGGSDTGGTVGDLGGSSLAGVGGAEAAGGQSGSAGVSVGCDHPDRTAEQDELVARSLEIVADSTAETVARLAAELEDGSYLESTAELLRQRGAQTFEGERADLVIAEGFISLIPEMLCWPGVVSAAVIDNYWDVFERPWDTAQVGQDECPIVDGACFEHCSPVAGSVLDDELDCLWVEEVVVCSVDQFARSMEPQCRLGPTGDAYVFSEIAPLDPLFMGWRSCPVDVRDVMLAPRPICE